MPLMAAKTPKRPFWGVVGTLPPAWPVAGAEVRRVEYWVRRRATRRQCPPHSFRCRNCWCGSQWPRSLRVSWALCYSWGAGAQYTMLYPSIQLLERSLKANRLCRLTRGSLLAQCCNKSQTSSACSSDALFSVSRLAGVIGMRKGFSR